MKYKLLCAQNEIELNKLVNDELIKGWKLYGDPSCSTGKWRTIYCQAVTKD